MPESIPTPEGDLRRATSFGEDATRYDSSRPGYPDELIESLLSGNPRRVIDVGCGTGIASRALLASGCSVLGVEPDPRMAAVALGYGIDVEVSSFEAWLARGRQFDLLISAQAWHWVDPALGAARAAEIVRSGGGVAFFWNIGRLGHGEQIAFDACHERIVSGASQLSVIFGHGIAERVERCSVALSNDGRFDQVAERSYLHRVRYTREEWLDQLETHSFYRTLAPDLRRSLFAALGDVVDSYGGSIELPYETLCVSARRSTD